MIRNKSSLRSLLSSRFPAVSDAEWMEALTRDLKTDKPLSRLGTAVAEGILAPAFLRDSEALAPVPTPKPALLEWIECGPDLLPDIHEAVDQGTDAVCIHVTSRERGSLAGLKALEGDPELEIPLHIDAGEFSADVFEHFPSLTGRFETVVNDSRVAAVLKETSLPHSVADLTIDAARLGDAGADPVCWLSYLFLAASELMENRTAGEGDDSERVLCTASLPGHLFTGIAALRAARIGLCRIAEQNGLRSSEIVIRARPSLWYWTAIDPQMNLLRGTIAGVASMIGGASQIEIPPHTRLHPAGKRWARNIQHLLREESHLHRIQDPSAGSYLVEDLTRQLGSKSWSRFTELKSRGGLRQTAVREAIKENVVRSAEADRDAISSRKETVVGANRFADDQLVEFDSQKSPDRTSQLEQAREAMGPGAEIDVVILSQDRQANARFADAADTLAVLGVRARAVELGSDSSQIQSGVLICGSDEDYQKIPDKQRPDLAVCASPSDDANPPFGFYLSGKTRLIPDLIDFLREYAGMTEEARR